MLSSKNWYRISLLVAPIDLLTPISILLSSTDITITFAIATPPTNKATDPSPRSKFVKASSAACWASRASEGRVIKIPYKGSLHDTVQDYLGGLRSTCTYINSPTIKQMAKCTTFVQVNQQLNTHFV